MLLFFFRETYNEYVFNLDIYSSKNKISLIHPFVLKK